MTAKRPARSPASRYTHFLRWLAKQIAVHRNRPFRSRFLSAMYDSYGGIDLRSLVERRRACLFPPVAARRFFVPARPAGTRPNHTAAPRRSVFSTEGEEAVSREADSPPTHSPREPAEDGAGSSGDHESGLVANSDFDGATSGTTRHRVAQSGTRCQFGWSIDTSLEGDARGGRSPAK